MCARSGRFLTGSRRSRSPRIPPRQSSTSTCGLRSASTYVSAKPPNLATPAPHDAPSFDIAGEERLLQDIVDEALAQGVWITRTRRLRGQEFVEARTSIRLAVTAVLSRKECDHPTKPLKAKYRSIQVYALTFVVGEDDHGRGYNAKTIKTAANHGGDDDKDNQDDHGGGDDDAKTITAVATTAKTIKTAMATRRQSRTAAAAAMTTTMRRQSRWRRRREDGGGGDNQDGGGVGDSGSDEGGGRAGDVDGIG
ncbi:hypothetical protein EDB85DRAFT_2237926 [Lactarius pseudohatsudake]|nr:hypothetical protein EDB85DRAFT_2237926 [Lactarius pseudohatsudake]